MINISHLIDSSSSPPKPIDGTGWYNDNDGIFYRYSAERGEWEISDINKPKEPLNMSEVFRHEDKRTP